MKDYVDATWGWDESDQAARFRQSFSAEGLSVIELDGRSIGSFRVLPDRQQVTIASIAIAPHSQRQGYGSTIIRKILNNAGSTPVLLQVLKVNPARALYERLGFRVTEQTPTHWRMRHDGSA